jgi:hypothetical protein
MPTTVVLSSVTATPEEFMSYSITADVGRLNLPPPHPYKNEFIVTAGGHRTFSHHQLVSTTIHQPLCQLPLIHRRHCST